MTVTGERVTTASGGFNPTWQRHVAAYQLIEQFLPEGRVLDVGCGVGHSYKALAPRETVGVDVDPACLAGQARETVVADMRRLPLPDGSFAAAVAIQSIEHVPDGGPAVSEMARVLEPGGVAVLVTPNRLTFARPDEIVDPYHYIEYDPGELEALCSPFFATVEMRGLFGSARYLDLVAAEREKLDRLLAKDPLRLRRAVPRGIRQRTYDWLLTRDRAEPDPVALEITPGDFEVREHGLAESLDVVAVCRKGPVARHD